MATKAKNSAEPKKQATNSGSDLPGKLSQALELLHNQKFEAAQTALLSLMEEARAQQNLAAVRRIQVSLDAIQARMNPEDGEGDAAARATYLINRGEVAEAQTLLEKALKSDASPQFCYLMSLVQVHLNNLERASEYLHKAVDGDESFLNLFHMEPDFDDVRYSQAFAEFGRE